MFHLCLVILPPRPEAAVFIPIAKRIFQVFGDADCRTAFCVVGNEFIARGVLGDAENEYLSFIDPDSELVASLGLTHLPAFVHLRQNTTLVAAAEGWDPARVAEGRQRSREVDGVERADRRRGRRSATHARLARLTIDALTCTIAVTNAQCWHGARGFARVPQVRTGETPCTDVLLLGVNVVHRDVFSKDRNGLAGGVPI